MNPAVSVPGEWVPAMVDAGVMRCTRQRLSSLAVGGGTPIEEAARAERLARLCEREARWWRVLERWLLAHPDEWTVVFGRAVAHTVAVQAENAHRWRMLAGDWRRLVNGEPICLVIGCGCGGSDACGVAS
ncbi:MAG TPA: hypothetical protein VFE65_28495 [Pseudonocardia sp.]|jgi:hypothetical protein|nr:hypothetical protein [Pseudonocardia sp.]